MRQHDAPGSRANAGAPDHYCYRKRDGNTVATNADARMLRRTELRNANCDSHADRDSYAIVPCIAGGKLRSDLRGERGRMLPKLLRNPGQ